MITMQEASEKYKQSPCGSKPHGDWLWYGDPGGIRTPDPRLRRGSVHKIHSNCISRFCPKKCSASRIITEFIKDVKRCKRYINLYKNVPNSETKVRHFTKNGASETKVRHF